MNVRVHTCHDECPCQRGKEPMRDFIPAEGMLWPVGSTIALLRAAGVDEGADALDRAQRDEHGRDVP